MQEISWKDVSTPHKQASHVCFDLKNNRPKPTGRRKITRAEQIWNQKLTGKFKTTSRAEVLLTFKKASPELGINDAVCRLIDLLCCWTKPVDWQENGWPLVWPSNDTLCEHLGFDERKLQRIRTKAIDTGLIRMCETRDNKRWGRRRNNDPEAVIVEGCGYDLSPLAERREEFLALIQQAEERRKQKGYLRRACSHWKRKILGHTDYALQQGYNERKWLSLAQEAQSLSRKVFRLQTIEPIFELELSLQRLYKKVKIEITKDEKKIKKDHNQTNHAIPSPSLLNSVNMSPTGDKFNGSYTTTNNKIISKANTNEVLTDMAQEEKKDLLRERILPNKIKPDTLKTPDLFNGFTVTPHFILKIAPTFREWITSKIINWNTVENALPYVLQHLKINPYIWKQACRFFGLQQAIIVIAIIEAKHALKSVKNPGGLLRAFITLYQQGKLHLDKTLFGLIHTLSIV